MQIVRKESAERFEDGTVFDASEYHTSDKDINTARIKIRGRYPVTGFMRNTKVKEIVYIEAGSGGVTINGTSQEVKEGDVVFFGANETVAWDGNFTLITTCTPAWSKGQHEFLP